MGNNTAVAYMGYFREQPIWDAAKETKEENDLMIISVNGSGSKTFFYSSFSSSYRKYIDEVYIYLSGEKVQLWKYGVTSTWVNSYSFSTGGDHEIYIKLRQDAVSSSDAPYAGNFYFLPNSLFQSITMKIIQWPKDLNMIGASCFRSATVNAAPKLPPNLLIVWHDAFNGCAGIAKDTGVMDFGDHLTSLGKYCLYGSKTNLTHIIIRSPLSDSGVDSWFNSYSIFNSQYADIVITEGCTRFCQYMFSNTSGKVYCLGTTPPTFPTPTGSISRTFYVPIGYGDVYKTAWSGVVDSSKIVEGACPYTV